MVFVSVAASYFIPTGDLLDNTILFFSSGTGLHQRASLPGSSAGTSNDGFTDDVKAQDSSHGETGVDESRVDFGNHASDADDVRLVKKNSFKTRWGKLKRRLSLETEHIDSPSFDGNEILPDELEYIEGGDIVPSSPRFDRASKHSLGTLLEEKDSDKTKKAEDDNNSAMAFTTRPYYSTKPRSPRKSSKSPSMPTLETRM